MTKGKIAHNEQFLILPPCIQLYSIIVLSFIESFRQYYLMFLKFSAADLLYEGKGYMKTLTLIPV